MPIFRIPDRHLFPDPTLAEPSGLLGVGGDLDAGRVVLAYRLGIFPWYSEDQPILWWSPDPRTILEVDELHIPRSLAKRIRRNEYTITIDRAFEQVIHTCAAKPRPDQKGTWITSDMETAYVELHRLGYAHSVEAWYEGELVGGLYGMCVGDLFCGESMFAHRTDASKVAFVYFVRHLANWGVPLVDCQVYTSHLERFGAKPIRRVEYLRRIGPLVQRQDRRGPWSFTENS
ncbi:MAG: leucyl/phenylalanyl-tRNA--protein transferase [Proteobacteria bacterium]|jgi:leucyl/phenylalanyl-tRNA---protein transferase|nr:leucyl/phenylalanyl-tRNA--protein transferase [Pseudomonadota bacterium]